MTEMMTNENHAIFLLEIYDILKEYDKQLSKQERAVLADALVLNERKEPVLQVLGQLYMRLRHFDRPDDDEIIEGGMHPAVQALYEKLGQDEHIRASMVLIPGVTGYRAITWDDARFGNKMTEDEGFIGGGYVIFDPSEKDKTMEERTAIPKSDVVENARQSTFSQVAGFWFKIFLFLIFTLLVLGWIFTNLMK